MQKDKMGMENGRSMAEMLGVLAMIGVLSIGGIVGYGYAVRLYQEAETLDQLSVTIAGGRTWDIPLHFGPLTVGVGEDYVPYVVPIRDVVSKVKYRTTQSAMDANLISEDGRLKPDVTMHDVREYESFDTLLSAPAWVRAEDEENWTVRVTGLSYSLCEKLLMKHDLGFDYGYVAVQGADNSPRDVMINDFASVDKSEKYANPKRDVTEGSASIENVCSALDPTKGSISLAKRYVENLDNPKLTGVATGKDVYCQDKKSIKCLANGARVYNPTTKAVDLPLQTLVLYFGAKSGGDLPPIPPDKVCVPNQPYTVESGGRRMTKECCETEVDGYFIESECCQKVENTQYEPRCVVNSDGFFAIDIEYQTDAAGNILFDAAGEPIRDEKVRLIKENITSETPVYIGKNWAGEDSPCCDATTDNIGGKNCHISSIDNMTTPWVVLPQKGTNATQYQNCPHGSPASQTTYITTENCCTGSGEYWAISSGRAQGSVSDSALGYARCCSKNNVFSYRKVSVLEQCSWDRSLNAPPSPSAGTTGADPKDIFGTTTTDCCFKQKGSGASKVLKESPCAYEAGILKYSKACCEISKDSLGNNLKYVYAPNYTVGGMVSNACGTTAGGTTGVSEPDRNCCVDYADVEQKKGPLSAYQKIYDWNGNQAPSYCCQTLITAARNEISMKNNFNQCCENELFFNTTNQKIRKKGSFIPAGTTISGHNALISCPPPLLGQSCSSNGTPYVTRQSQCCEIDASGKLTGLSSDGQQNKTCCDLASTTLKLYWDGSACSPCLSCSTPPPPGQDCHDACTYTKEIPGEEDQPTQTQTCNTEVCELINGNCCQSEGYLPSGAASCDCCTDPPGKAPNDSCFLGADASDIEPKDCFTITETPGTSRPGYMVSGTRILRTYTCPAGVAPGTVTIVGDCSSDSDGDNGGDSGGNGSPNGSYSSD